MAKKLVAKKLYYTCNTLYHLLCLSGLIWQVTQISVNFFKFDVNINIYTPDETTNQNKVLDHCSLNHEIVNNRSYYKSAIELFKNPNNSIPKNINIKNKEYIVRHLSMRNRFSITRPMYDSRNVEFVFGELFCQRCQPKSNQQVLHVQLSSVGWDYTYV